MLDHIFIDAIGAIRDGLESALLERQAFEEHFQTDVLVGDTSWETSYGLPGEGLPPRVKADITMVWPTWAQTAYRSWYIGDPPDESPRITIELVFRLQRLAGPPDPAIALDVLPRRTVTLGNSRLTRDSVTVETAYSGDLRNPSWALEATYAGDYVVPEEVMADGAILDEQFGGLGGWVASLLVQLGDLPLEYLKAGPE